MPIHDVPSGHLLYSFPLDTIGLKSTETGGYVESKIIHLTKFRARFWVDWPWSRFRGPFIQNYQEQPDAHWKWHTFVRRLRKEMDLIRCAAVQTADERIQGAIIYRRNGASLLEPHLTTVSIEYLASAPHNRKDCARTPSYSGVGEGLLTLAILQSYEWGLGGRVTLFSLPGSLGFYKKYDFVETGAREGRMIHCELRSEAAISYLEARGLI